jgi:Uncharacterized conserved protein
MKPEKKFIFREISDYFFILIGLSIYALGWTGFLLPAEITTGGVTGLAAIIFFGTGIPVAVSYFSVNAVLLIIAIRLFGFKFSFKTIINVIFLTFFLSFLQSVIKEPILKDDVIMNCLVGGILCGTGLGIVLNFNGSTGGTDIVALIINKYRDISIGRAYLFCDVLIISSSYLVFHSLEKVVYGLVVMGIITYTVDLVINGKKASVQFFIFSYKAEEISKEIIKNAHRGCTLLDGTGGYSQESVKVIVCMVKKSESSLIFRIIRDIDPKAFITQASVRGVYGQGFDPIKVK